MRLKTEEFIRRFLLHVLPIGYVRIRHYGLLAGRHRNAKLNQCRLLLGLPPQTKKERQSNLEILQELSGTDPTEYPFCGQGHLIFMIDLFSHLVANHSPPVKAA